MELTRRPGMSLLFVKRAAPPGKTRSSPTCGIWILSFQLRALLQALVLPPPSQVSVAGEKRASRVSTPRRVFRFWIVLGLRANQVRNHRGRLNFAIAETFSCQKDRKPSC